MSSVFRLGQEEPLFHLGDFPVRLITLLIALHSAAMIGATLLLASGHAAILDALAYSSAAVAHGQVWRLLTYAYVDGPSIWFLLEMLMLYYFGSEVENGLGWKRFGILYVGLILLGPLLLQAFSYAAGPQSFTGAQEINFAVFAAFTTMHPGAQFFFGVAARWVFAGLFAISSLQSLAAHQPARVLVLAGSSFLAVFLMKRSGFSEPLFGLSLGQFFPSLRGLLRRKPRFSVVEGGKMGKVSAEPRVESSFDPEGEMDRLLEKIARQGIGSLTSAEKAALERARQAMLARGSDA